MKIPLINQYSRFILLLLLSVCMQIITSCGYSIIGSTLLPFNTVTVKPVVNMTYEPRIEEKMHYSLSNEFINQGIDVRTSGGDLTIETVITSFQLGAIGAVDERVKEQELLMKVDIRVIDGEHVIEFKSMQSPIKITFQSTGSVSQSAAEKERATDKACREIAKEVVSRVILSYAK